MSDQVFGGRYRIERHVARGGMAEVYLAHDTLLDRPVALKVLFPELARDATFVERFRREAQSAARLNHRNIVSVFDFGRDGSAFYIVMEYVDGRPLSEIIASEAPLAVGRAVAIAADVAAGLEAAHREGIIHRDVKPANVLVAANVAKVADFGIARVSAARLDLTMPGTVIGTATYLSPEQAQVAEVDQRSDVYSLGLVLYEMLTGRPPFQGDNLAAVFYQQQHQRPPPASSINPGVPAGLDAAVGRAISFNPRGRQVSAAAFRAEIIAAAHSTQAGVVEATAIEPALAPTSVQLPPERPLAVIGEAVGATEVAAVGTSGAGAAGALPGQPRGGYRRQVDPVEEAARRRRIAALAAGLAILVVLVVGAVLLSHNHNGAKTVTTVPSTVAATATSTTVGPTITAATTPATRATTTIKTTTTMLPATTVTATTSPAATTAATRATTPSTSPVTTATPATT